MARVKFNCKGRFADIGKAGEQFDHDVDQICDVSAQCAQDAVGYDMAEHVVAKAEGNPAEKDKGKADKDAEKERIKALKAELKGLGGKGYSKFSEEELIAAIAEKKADGQDAGGEEGTGQGADDDNGDGDSGDGDQGGESETE